MPDRLLAPAGIAVSVTEFTHEGATMVVEDFGDGRPFVVLHGIGLGRSTYLELIRRLDERVIAVDLPGFGEAPEPDRTPTMAEHADLVAAWLRHTGVQPACVIGHSMGSQIAAELAARHPDRVGGVVLVGPTVDAAARTIPRQAALLVRELIAERRRLSKWRGAREYLRAGPNLARKLRATIEHEPETVFPRIACPALVLRGERDLLAPQPWCEQIVAAIPRAELATIAAHGHGAVISNPEPAARRISEFAAGL